jgi:hypothetical protein
MVRKRSLALATATAALTMVSAADIASAQHMQQNALRALEPCDPCGSDGGTGMELLLRAPQPNQIEARPKIGLGSQVGGTDDVSGYNARSLRANQSLPGATPRPTNRDLRMAPSMSGRGMRMNGGMGRR